MRPKKYGKTIPMTFVKEEVIAAVEEIMQKQSVTRAEAVRRILDMGLIYMAIYGDE